MDIRTDPCIFKFPPNLIPSINIMKIIATVESYTFQSDAGDWHCKWYKDEGVEILPQFLPDSRLIVASPVNFLNLSIFIAEVHEFVSARELWPL